MKWIWLTLLLAVSQAAHADDAPRFLIERIDVRNVRFVSPAIIRAELRLPAGHEYTENELRKASDRVNRLPFVLDSEFSLEKGSTRGAYVLVITVTETKPLFYSTAAGWNFTTRPSAVQLRHPGATNTVGGRLFAGSSTEAHVAVTNDYNSQSHWTHSLEGGITRYGLFGDSAFAQLNISAPLSGPYHSFAPDLLIGIPLGQTRTLSIDYATLRSSFSQKMTMPTGVVVGGAETKVVVQSLQTNFAYNTTDEPFFPTRGVILGVSPVVSRTHIKSKLTLNGYGSFSDSYHAEDRALSLEGVRYWQLAETNSLSTLAILTRDATYSGPDNHHTTTDSGHIDVGLLHRFRPDKGRLVSHEMGLEFHVTYDRSHTDTNGRPFGSFSDATTTATAAWAYRSAWGTVRLGATFRRPSEVSPYPPVPPSDPSPLTGGGFR